MAQLASAERSHAVDRPNDPACSRSSHRPQREHEAAIRGRPANEDRRGREAPGSREDRRAQQSSGSDGRRARHKDGAHAVERNLAKARTMVRRGAFAEAFQLYAALVASHPSNARAREGLVKLRSQDLTSPKSDTKLERRLGQAQALMAAGRATEAGAVASELHARHPKVMRTALAMGQAHLALGQAADAASRFATATPCSRPLRRPTCSSAMRCTPWAGRSKLRRPTRSRQR